MGSNNYRNMTAAAFREVVGIKLEDLEEGIKGLVNDVKDLVDSNNKHDRRIERLETAATIIANDKKSKRRAWAAIITAIIMAAGSVLGTGIIAAVTLISHFNGGM